MPKTIPWGFQCIDVTQNLIWDPHHGSWVCGLQHIIGHSTVHSRWGFTHCTISMILVDRVPAVVRLLQLCFNCPPMIQWLCSSACGREWASPDNTPQRRACHFQYSSTLRKVTAAMSPTEQYYWVFQIRFGEMFQIGNNDLKARVKANVSWDIQNEKQNEMPCSRLSVKWCIKYHISI